MKSVILLLINPSQVQKYTTIDFLLSCSIKLPCEKISGIDNVCGSLQPTVIISTGYSSTP